MKSATEGSTGGEPNPARTQSKEEAQARRKARLGAGALREPPPKPMNRIAHHGGKTSLNDVRECFGKPLKRMKGDSVGGRNRADEDETGQTLSEIGQTVNV